MPACALHLLITLLEGILPPKVLVTPNPWAAQGQRRQLLKEKPAMYLFINSLFFPFLASVEGKEVGFLERSLSCRLPQGLCGPPSSSVRDDQI